MYKQRTLLFIFLFCMCGVSRYFAQITSSTPSIGGCAPLAVTYSAPAGSSGDNWDFGNGQTSTSASGSYNYLNAGTYTVTYTGTVGGNATTFTVIAYVVAKPVTQFSIIQAASNCAPKTVTVTDQSTGSFLNQWIWTYGDGGSNTYTVGGSHTYTYFLPGTYNISLQVYDIYGCTDQKTVGTVSVFASPVAVISSNPPVLFSCTPPFSAAFSAASSLGSNLTYSWNFGNGQTSTSSTPPNATYTATGTYAVNLTVSGNGCSSTATTAVIVSPTTLTAAAPATVCLNSPFTVTVQSNQSTTSWNFGNGVGVLFAASSQTPVMYSAPAYTSLGVYNITVTAGSSPCQVKVTQPVLVDQVVANFTVAPINSCSSPFIVTYSAQCTPNATSFNWAYPTWQKDTLYASGPNPTFTFTENSDNPYTIYTTYAPSMSLVAVSPAGCMDTISLRLDSITRPTAWFYKTKQQGCAPLTVTYVDTSFVYPFNPVTSYTWSNGESPPVLVSGSGSNIPSVTFTYNSAGTYTPFLTIQTANGCSDVSFVDTVYVANSPTVSFNFAPTGTICPSQTLQIINTTPMPTFTQVTHWHVSGDDGYFSGCISDPNPAWNFSHIGQHTLSLTGYVHECPGTSPVYTIYVNGPIVQGRYATNCTNRLSVDFSSDLQAVTNATLDFGDFSPPHLIVGNAVGTSSDLATHVYTATGDYTATLTGVNPGTGCAASIYTMLVTVRDIVASLSSSSVVCQNVGTLFNASASKDVLIGCSRGYVWYIDNAPPIDTTGSAMVFGFSTVGTHTVTLMVKDINSCSATSSVAIRVSSVTPNFSLSSPTICVNGSVQFTNTSTTTSTDVINTYAWSFGDGQVSSLPSPSHTYVVAQSPYTTDLIYLTVTNNLGCTGTVSQSVKVFKPNALFYASQYSICVGPTTVTFTGVGINSSYSLNVGSNPPVVSSSNIIPYTFATAGVSVVTMSVKDANGCESDNAGGVTIYAQQTPTANFIFSSPKSTTGNKVICSPATVSFTDASQPSQIYAYNWNLGTGNPVVSQSVVSYPYNYSVTTAITVSLTVTTSYFCQSTYTANFTVYSPKAQISLDRNIVCLGDPVKFNIIDSTGSGIKGWVWDYGDASSSGGTITAASAPPSFTIHPYNSYPPSGTATVSLIYYSAQYACVDQATAAVQVIKIDADIKRNNEAAVADSVHCLKIQDNFYNTSPGSTSALTWSFGDGATSTQQNPSYTYPLPGVYQVSLAIVEGSLNCQARTAKNMTINPLPIAAIASVDSVCQNAPFTLIGSGTSTAGITNYQWTSVNAIQSPSAATTLASASVSSTYSLAVTDGNGCVSPPAIKLIYIQQPPPHIMWDTAVIIGQSIPLNTQTGPSYTYSWVPTKDLSCLNCIYPISTSTVDVTYSVTITDALHCFLVTNTYSITIDPESSVDVPTAFTPNGDGVNDIIYVAGWGIKKLNYFRIFNRWGELLFESNDIKIGWDGNFNGVPQNMETYVYQVSVETYLSTKGLMKTSSFRLIR